MPFPKKNLQKIKVNLIDIGKTQMRNVNVKYGLEELAESIKILGLLEPILVRKVGDKYEVLAGQRRFLAISEILKWDEIDAIVYEDKIDDMTASAISATENIMVLPPHENDFYDVCTKLYNHYGSFKAVSQKTGLPSEVVKRFVNYVSLPKELKKMVDTAEIDIKTAKKARDAAISSKGEIDEKKAMDIAKIMKGMTPTEQTQLKNIANESPDAKVEEIITKAKEPPKEEFLKIRMLKSDGDKLLSYANSVKKSKEEAALDIILSAIEPSSKKEE